MVDPLKLGAHCARTSVTQATPLHRIATPSDIAKDQQRAQERRCNDPDRAANAEVLARRILADHWNEKTGKRRARIILYGDQPGGEPQYSRQLVEDAVKLLRSAGWCVFYRKRWFLSTDEHCLLVAEWSVWLLN